MEEILKKLLQSARKEIKQAENLAAWDRARVNYLGRKGELTKLLRGLKDQSEEQKRQFGSAANEVKKQITAALASRKSQLEKNQQLPAIDVTMPPLQEEHKGRLHPVTQLELRIWEVFSQLNFDIQQTPEIETDYYNFAVLNQPPDHPARDMQDTFYLGAQTDKGENWLLRTQTTAMQARYAAAHRPPFRVVVTGKCFRRDGDLTHTPMFHQFDGLWVDSSVTVADLKGLLQTAMSRILEQDIEIRFRISYFPFVEPGAEFDVSCTLCGGEGCATCKYSGWIEMGGCGMVHPQVIKNFGLDPRIHQGIAWGFGVERPFMIKHRIPDLRLFFQNNLSFLRQF